MCMGNFCDRMVTAKICNYFHHATLVPLQYTQNPDWQVHGFFLSLRSILNILVIGKRFRQNSHHLHCLLFFQQIFGGFYFADKTSTKRWFDILLSTFHNTMYFPLRYLRSIENILLTNLTPLEEPNRSTAKERKCKLKQRVFFGQVSYETIIFCLYSDYHLT